MKNRSERLSPVLKLEKMKEEQAVKVYAQSNSKLQLELQKLEQLLSYSREYELMIVQAGRAGLYATQLHSYHHFLARLNHAIGQQREQIVLVKQRTKQHQESWLHQRGATQNMGKLISRCASQERQEQDKKEQRAMDEYAQQSRSAHH